MATFTLFLQSSTQYEEISQVESFVGEDSSGKFGILAGSARLMSCLTYGLSWFRYENGAKEYLALPGAVLYFDHQSLFICTRHYLHSPDYQTIVHALDEELLQEETQLHEMKEGLHQLDQAIIQRLWKMGREGYNIE